MLPPFNPHTLDSLSTTDIKQMVQQYLVFTTNHISQKVAKQEICEVNRNPTVSKHEGLPTGNHLEKNYKIAKSISITTMATGRQFLSQSEIKSANFIQPPAKINESPFKRIVKSIRTQLQCSGYLFEFKGDFIESKYYFLKIASQSGFSVSRDTERLLTVKKANGETLKSFFAVCLPLFNQRPVYQLQYRKKQNSRLKKIQLIRVSGKQEEYLTFGQSLIFQYWKNSLLDLTDQELAEIVCLIDTKIFKSEFIFCGKALSLATVKKLQSGERVEIWREQFIANVKRAEKKILSKFYEENSEKQMNKQKFEEELKLCLFRSLGGMNFYEEISKEKNVDFFNTRRSILESTTLQRVFKFLEIDFLGLTNLSSMLESLDHTNLPFFTSIQILNNLSKDSPFSYNLSLIRKFCCQMAQTYYNHKRSLKIAYEQQKEEDEEDVFDMDTQLPVTIFCVLMCNNQETQIITTFLSDYYQYEDNYGTENRILTAINAAYDFIRNQWPSEKQENA